MNYNTQDKDYNQNFENNELGSYVERRPSIAMQTQTLIMPYSERQGSGNNLDESQENMENSPLDQNINNEQEVDHRFESEEDEIMKKKNNDNLEELKEASIIQTPQKMSKMSRQGDTSIVNNNNLDETQRIDHNSLASVSKDKSNQDEIKDFIEE